MLTKYIKRVLWGVAVRLRQYAWCLKVNWHLSRSCDVFSWRHHKLWLSILAIYNTFSSSSIRFITTKTRQPYIWHGSNTHCVLDLDSKWMPQVRVCFRLPEPRKAFSPFTGVCVCFCAFIYFCSRWISFICVLTRFCGFSQRDCNYKDKLKLQNSRWTPKESGEYWMLVLTIYNKTSSPYTCTLAWILLV